MLSSGTAASSRSANVRPIGVERALATLTSSSVGARAEHDARIQVGLPPHEPARHFGQRARIDDEPKPLVRGIGDRHEYRVRLHLGQHALDLEQPTQHGHTLQAPPREPRVVVDEADDLLAGGLAEFAQQAAAAAPGADDERAPPLAAPGEGRNGPYEAALPEARRADDDDAHERVDDEDAARERAPDLRRVEDQVRDELGDDDRADDRGGVACAGVTPDAPIEPEWDEREVARREQHRQRDLEDVPVVWRAAALQAQVVRERERRRDEREVDERLDEAPRVRDERAEPAALLEHSRRPLDVGKDA